MIPPVFTLLQANPDVVALLGEDPFKVFPWGEAPQGTKPPYVTYKVYNGQPENMLDRVPQMDNLGTQVDVWARNGAEAAQIAAAVRDTLEPHAHMTSIDDMDREPDTKLYRFRLDFDFFTGR